MDVFASAKTLSDPFLDSSAIIGYDTAGLTIATEAGGDVTTKPEGEDVKTTEKPEETTGKQTIKTEEENKKKEQDEKKKEQEKTINDINTFLIESYKLKIDKILSNLNLSLERITNNDPAAQAKLLEKIRGDIDAKIQIINSRDISENRRKILSSVFSYIQENLNTKISTLVGKK